MLENKNILITGGTGSFGQKFVEVIIDKFKPNRLVIFSRDELKQYEMAVKFSTEKYPFIRYFIGDVRDKDRVIRACAGIDVIIHAAAMKQIVAAEYNPTECIATNVIGAQNIIDAALENRVNKVIAISTDKAASPINLYGATKLCSDKLFVAGNNLSGKFKTRFSVVRYGNVVGSRGSIIPFFKKLVNEGHTLLPITHKEMTRFFITLNQGVDLVIKTISEMYGGEIIVPKLPSAKILDIIPLLGKNLSFKEIGIRPGEKLHEVMIPQDEVRNTIDMGNHFVIQPNHPWWNISNFKKTLKKKGKEMSFKDGYISNNNDWWLSQKDLNLLIKNN